MISVSNEVLYRSTVTGKGEQAQDLIDDRMVVIFKEGAPSELAEISVLHSPEEESFTDLQEGDLLQIDQQSFQVLAVGEEANKNMEKLGHATLKFNGATETELPGDINLEDKPLPELEEGVTFSFLRPA